MSKNDFSPNGFTIHRIDDNVIEENKIEIFGADFQDENEYYPDFNNTKIDKEIQDKLNILKEKNESEATLIKSDDIVMDVDNFFNNISQIYLLYNICEKI